MLLSRWNVPASMRSLRKITVDVLEPEMVKLGEMAKVDSVMECTKEGLELQFRYLDT